MVVANETSAQIIVTDINPDSLLDLNGDVVNIDFNNDATVDITFTLTKMFYAGTTYSPARSSSKLSAGGYGQTLRVASSYYNVADMLNPGTTIGSFKKFNSSYSKLFQAQAPDTTFTGMVSTASKAAWVAGSINKFVGVRFNIGSSTYYGWVLMSISNDYNSSTVKSFAYNATAGGSIWAGQTATTGLANSIEEEYKISYTENILSLREMTQGGTVKMFTSNGIELLNGTVHEGDNTYAVSNLKQGVYVVNVNLGDKVITKKIIVY